MRIGHRSQLHVVHENVRDGVHAGQQQIDRSVVEQVCADVERALESPRLRNCPSQLKLVVPGTVPNT